jgi:short-subunit dehydrogenase
MTSILILGGTSDMAISIAEEYLSNQYKIILAARSLERLDIIKRDLQIKLDGEIDIRQFDAADIQSHVEFVRSLDPLPEITLCAFGYLGDQSTAKRSIEECLKIINVNFTGAVSVLNLISECYKSKRAGTIIGLSSVAGERGRQSNYIYGSAKAAFTSYLSGLRNELFHFGCHVMTVKPGFVNTKMTEHLELNPWLTAEPKQVAKAVYRGAKRKRNTIYVLKVWWLIMLVIRYLPEAIFKRLKL